MNSFHFSANHRLAGSNALVGETVTNINVICCTFTIGFRLWSDVRKRTSRAEDNLALHKRRAQLLVVAVVLSESGWTGAALGSETSARVARSNTCCSACGSIE